MFETKALASYVVKNRWEDIPDTWTCPDCGVTKDDFEMELA